jgi:hypothetical protein
VAQPVPKWSLLDLRVCRYAVTQKTLLNDEVKGQSWSNGGIRRIFVKRNTEREISVVI